MDSELPCRCLTCVCPVPEPPLRRRHRVLEDLRHTDETVQLAMIEKRLACLPAAQAMLCGDAARAAVAAAAPDRDCAARRAAAVVAGETGDPVVDGERRRPQVYMSSPTSVVEFEWAPVHRRPRKRRQWPKGEVAGGRAGGQAAKVGDDWGWKSVRRLVAL